MYSTDTRLIKIPNMIPLRITSHIPRNTIAETYLNCDMFAKLGRGNQSCDTSLRFVGAEQSLAQIRITFGFTILYNAKIACCASKGRNRLFHSDSVEVHA